MNNPELYLSELLKNCEAKTSEIELKLRKLEVRTTTYHIRHCSCFNVLKNAPLVFIQLICHHIVRCWKEKRRKRQLNSNYMSLVDSLWVPENIEESIVIVGLGNGRHATRT